jgi:hypothetical protein
LIWISFSFYITPAKINVQGVYQTKCKVKFREFIGADGVSNTVRGNIVREEATVSSNFTALVAGASCGCVPFMLVT